MFRVKSCPGWNRKCRGILPFWQRHCCWPDQNLLVWAQGFVEETFCCLPQSAQLPSQSHYFLANMVIIPYSLELPGLCVQICPLKAKKLSLLCAPLLFDQRLSLSFLKKQFLMRNSNIHFKYFFCMNCGREASFCGHPAPYSNILTELIRIKVVGLISNN